MFDDLFNSVDSLSNSRVSILIKNLLRLDEAGPKFTLANLAASLETLGSVKDRISNLSETLSELDNPSAILKRNARFLLNRFGLSKLPFLSGFADDIDAFPDSDSNKPGEELSILAKLCLLITSKNDPDEAFSSSLVAIDNGDFSSLCSIDFSKLPELLKQARSLLEVFFGAE